MLGFFNRFLFFYARVAGRFVMEGAAVKEAGPDSGNSDEESDGGT